jgi:hypothetical protein
MGARSRRRSYAGNCNGDHPATRDGRYKFEMNIRVQRQEHSQEWLCHEGGHSVSLPVQTQSAAREILRCALDDD